MVTSVATLLLTALAGGGFITPMHAITPSGTVWPLDDIFNQPMRTPHPQGARVLAAAGDASGSAYILAHDRNVEILVYGVNANGMRTFNQTDTPRDMRSAGTLKMWALSGGRFFVQSDAKEVAWIFDNVKQWTPTDYLPGLKSMEPYNGGVATLVKAPSRAKDEPTPAEPAKIAKDQSTTRRKVVRFIYLAVEGEQSLAAFQAEQPDLSDLALELELPKGAAPVTGFVPVVSPGYVVLQSGKKGLLVAVDRKQIVGEIALGTTSGTLVIDSDQAYSLTFGEGGRPQVTRLEMTPVQSKE